MHNLRRDCPDYLREARKVQLIIYVHVNKIRL
jgi:hypothetical protein